MTPDPLLLGIDIGGTKTAIELSGDPTDGPALRRVFPTPATGRDALRLLRAEARQLAGTRQVSAIGVSFGGLVNSAGLRSMHVPGWEDAGLLEALQADFAAPVNIANDAEAGALGEYSAHVAAGERWPVFVYVTISTGIGGAILLDGVPFLGSHGLSAEIGHMVVADTGLCSCGRTGHLEAQASGLAIARRAAVELRDPGVTDPRDAAPVVATRIGARAAAPDLGLVRPPVDGITAKDVSAAAERGDARAARILHDAGVAVGLVIANLAQLVDPGIVVIGGGVAQAGDHLWGPLLAKVHEHALGPVVVRPAVHGSGSALAGAVELARQVVREAR